jgi:hypothetical protein
LLSRSARPASTTADVVPSRCALTSLMNAATVPARGHGVAGLNLGERRLQLRQQRDPRPLLHGQVRTAVIRSLSCSAAPLT